MRKSLAISISQKNANFNGFSADSQVVFFLFTREENSAITDKAKITNHISLPHVPMYIFNFTTLGQV